MYRIRLLHELTEVKRKFTFLFVICDVHSNTLCNVEAEERDGIVELK